MTISFPLTIPSSISPNRVEWSQINAVGISSAPWTFEQQVHEYDGAAWSISVSYPPMTRAEAAPYMAFLSSLRGRRGTFLFGDTLMSSPQGTVSGSTPQVKGASQTGLTLNTDGWAVSTLVLKAGDFIQIDYNLYTITADATSDGSGEVTLDIWPMLRGHSDNASIITSSPKGLFRLSSNQITPIAAPANQHYSISFTAEEAL